MKITFLGTGTSTGVPQIGCSCKVCRSTDARDKRLRTSVLVETEQTRILLDCGPDFRQQILPLDFRRIDAVLLTHEHYDHVGGIDDLRPFGVFGDVQLYASERTGGQLRQSLPYCFVEHKYPGVPQLRLHAVRPHEAFRVGELQVTPIEVMHARLPILGYRVGRMAYIINSDRIKNPNRIHAGWQLKIPQSGAPITGGTPDAVLPENKKSGIYIVRQGDTLWAIARKCGCSVAEIVSLNRELIRNPALIHSGWELKVPQD